MDLNLSAEQEQLVAGFSGLYAKESSTERVRAAEPLGHDPELWARLCQLGVLDMAVGEDAGGWGASLLDLALVAGQHGRYLGSVPLIEAQVAVRFLAALGAPAASDALARALGGDGITTLALHPARDGLLTMVPSGAVADSVVVVDGERALSVGIAGARPVANLGSMPVADVAFGGHMVELAAGPGVPAAYERALDEWMTLMANALAGMGTRSIEIGVDYVTQRHAFGVPIGSFQSVAHGLADAATAVDGSVLLAQEAAWAAEHDVARAPELAALAFGFCTDSAREASYRSLHYHGGYGFMLEYDIQLYFRRARAWPSLYVEPAVAFARAERHRLAGGRRDG